MPSTVYPRVCGGTWTPGMLSGHRCWVYPRVCGGTCCSSRCATDRLSSGVYPRVCGGTLARKSGASTRQDPAVYPRVCGGTGSSVPDKAIRAVYPRVCGGTMTFRDKTRSGLRCQGLSPRVRGNHLRVARLHRAPAHTVYPRVCGGTARPAVKTPVISWWVYPRVCGGTFPDSPGQLL